MSRRTAFLALSLFAFTGYACGGDDTTAPERGPEVSIASPPDSNVSEPGELITFRGSASDPDGAAIDSLVWSSSRDGRLGEGASVVGALFTVGEHSIRLRAYADDGGTGDAFVLVRVKLPGAPTATSVIVALVDE